METSVILNYQVDSTLMSRSNPLSYIVVLQ